MQYGYSVDMPEFLPAMPYSAANKPKESGPDQRALFQDPLESVHKTVFLVLSTKWTGVGVKLRTRKLLGRLFRSWKLCHGMPIPQLKTVEGDWEKLETTAATAAGGRPPTFMQYTQYTGCQTTGTIFFSSSHRRFFPPPH